jgi:hypothetical protein
MVAVKNIELGNSRGSKEVIVASAWWMPPRTWLSPWSIITLLRSGIIQILRRWGITGFTVCPHPVLFVTVLRYVKVAFCP